MNGVPGKAKKRLSKRGLKGKISTLGHAVHQTSVVIPLLFIIYVSAVIPAEAGIQPGVILDSASSAE